MGFRKGKATTDAIVKLRMVAERAIQVNEKVYVPVRFVITRKYSTELITKS